MKRPFWDSKKFFISLIMVVVSSIMFVFPVITHAFSLDGTTLYCSLLGSALLMLLLFYCLLKWKRMGDLIEFIKYSPIYMRNNNVIFALSLATFCFFILYNKYIYGGEAYIFSLDLGTDTLDIIYPSYYMLSKGLHEGSLSLYSLQAGFGMNYIGQISILLQPFDLLPVLFPVDKIEIGIICSIYIKLFVLVIFSTKYFFMIYKDYKISTTCSLLWAFSSYVIIWGQQYSFGSKMVYFTIFTYFMHKLYSMNKGKVGLIIILLLISFSGYYLFYSIGVYSMGYLIVYGYIKGVKRNILLKKAMKMLGYAVLAIGLSSFILLPNICVFFNSARTEGMSGVFANLFKFVDLKTMISMIGRFFSSDLLGTAIDGKLYSNVNNGLNYYEMAFLSVSLISLFAINYNIYKYRKRRYFIIVAIIFLVISLSTYLVSYLITWGYNFRWSYMLVFIQVLMIGKYMQFILYEYEKPVALKVVVFTILEYAALTLILLISRKYAIITLDVKLLLSLWILLLLYSLLMLSCKMKSVVLCVMLFEILYYNNAPINKRGTEQIASLQKQYYHDGTGEFIDEMKAKDATLYRMNKTYMSRFYNDAQIQGYNGMSVYNSVNSANLQSLLSTYGVKESFNHPNYFKVNYDNLFLNGLFGVKYIISNGPLMGMEEIYSEDYFAYKNPYALPFGFLYDQQINASTIETENMSDYVFSGYFDDTNNGVLNNSELVEIKQNMKKVDNIYNLTLQDYQMTNYNAITFSHEGSLTGDVKVQFIVDGIVLKEDVFISETGMKETKVYFPYMKDVKEMDIKLEFVSNQSMPDSIDAFLQSYDESRIKALIAKYESQALMNIQYEGNHLSGDIVNSSTEDKMFFIPIVFSDEWSLYIDGEKRKVKSINGGFIGAEIEPGNHSLELVFIPQGLKLGGVITIISLSSIVLWYFMKKSSKQIS